MLLVCGNLLHLNICNDLLIDSWSKRKRWIGLIKGRCYVMQIDLNLLIGLSQPFKIKLCCALEMFSQIRWVWNMPTGFALINYQVILNTIPTFYRKFAWMHLMNVALQMIIAIDAPPLPVSMPPLFGDAPVHARGDSYDEYTSGGATAAGDNWTSSYQYQSSYHHGLWSTECLI